MFPDEWTSAVRCYMGTFWQRLRDMSHLKWDQFDFTARTVTIITRKTTLSLCRSKQEWFYHWAHGKQSQAQKICGDAAVRMLPDRHRHSNPGPEFSSLVSAFGIRLSG